MSRSNLLVRLVALTCILLVWGAASRFVSEGSTLPPPEKVFRAALEMWRSGELFQDLSASLKRIVVGFALALFAAIGLGITAARYGPAYRTLSVFLELLSSIPPIAWTPLAILWFGIGDAPAYFIVFLGSFFPMFVSVYSGIARVDRNLIGASQTLGASQSQVVSRIIVPCAIPSIFTGVRTGIGVAWFNVIAAELIGVRSGLGYKIQLSRTLLSSENVVAMMLIIGLLGWMMTKGVAILSALVAPWAIEDESRTKWISRTRMLRHPWKVLTTWLATCASSANSQALSMQVSTDAPVAPAQQEILLSVASVSKEFPGRSSDETLSVLDDVSFEIRVGEVFTIVGPNGSGKTTLLKIVAGLLNSDVGTVSFRGRAIDGPGSERTVIFQDFALFPWWTASGNLRFAQRVSHANARTAGPSWRLSRDRSESLLEQAGLSAFKDTYPADLSGGMKQRLALVRALAVDPILILMDEPFASFDPLVREESQQAILTLLSKKPVTVLLVTHDLDEALFMSDRVLVLSKRPGRAKAMIEVDFPRPRLPEIRRSSDFAKLRTHLWDVFRTPVTDHTREDSVRQ